ncbi:recombinase family protein [Candidatus Velamenicoccus archaeovorus]|nr:recombinase family protein [Candidatus Velamenicoccus archaeovorus]
MEETKQSKKRIYCAIYTRKSTSEGLDQNFTSLDAQREAAENYINSQKHEGWVVLQEPYDDGGFTGANMDRPGLQKLLSEIKNQKINCVVVYKVDRLSRSLTDFAQLLEFFDKNNVTFVSVTQSFNTNTSMGRLTLNILLSFAQFEREIARERTKDKMSAARKRGQWTGGIAPLGYCVDDNKKLIVDPEGAKVVREIFDLYLKGNSTLKIVHMFNEKGYKTNKIACKNGKTLGGVKYSVARIQWMLRHPIYMGKALYNGQIYDGEHEAIIDEETFKKTQALLNENHRERKATKNVDCTGLLSRILHCKICGTYMTHTYTIRNGTHKYRYYTCTNAQKLGHSSCPTRSVNSKAIEDAVVNCLREIFSDKSKREKHAYKQETDALLSPVWDTLHPQEKRRIFKILLKEVDYTASSKKLGITLADNDLRLEFDADLQQVRPLNKWHKEEEIKKEPTVRTMLVLAHQVQQLVNTGKIKHPREACKWLNLSVTRMDQTMNTLFLCPAIQSEILSTDTPAINALTEFKIRPLLKEAIWTDQLAKWQTLIAGNR